MSSVWGLGPRTHLMGGSSSLQGLPNFPPIIPNDQEGWAVPSALSGTGCGGPASQLLCLTPDNCSPAPRPGLI